MELVTAHPGGTTVLASGLIYGKPSREFLSGRVCNQAGCGTLLSRYNPASTCSVHEQLH
jgi:hypothetical protein